MELLQIDFVWTLTLSTLLFDALMLSHVPAGLYG